MNRHERRAAKTCGAIFVDYGHLLSRDQHYGSPVECYACGAAHKASGVARIQDKQSTTVVPLCEPCLVANSNEVVRKFLNAPDLEVTEGGEATTEQVIALADKQDSAEH